VLVPPMSVAYQDIQPTGIPHATMNTRIAQQVGASFGTAIVAVALQSLLAHGATSAFQGAFWWAIGITIAALIPALALPTGRTAGKSLRMCSQCRLGACASNGRPGRGPLQHP